MDKPYILITGAAKRIGKVIAIFLAKKGYNIVIHYHNSQKAAEELATYLEQTFQVKATTIKADFNDEKAINSIFYKLKQQNILVNVLINNASSFWLDDFFSYDSQKWQENFNTNLKAPYLLSLAFATHLKEWLGSNTLKKQQVNINNVASKNINQAASTNIVANKSNQLQKNSSPSTFKATKEQTLLAISNANLDGNSRDNANTVQSNGIDETTFKENSSIKGNIINIVDSAVTNINKRFLSYNLAKLALWRLTEVMALELAPQIRVNGVAPGLTMKPENMETAKFKAMFNQTPMQKEVNPLDIATAIDFILNTQSLYGEVIKVDGGKSLSHCPK